MIDLPNIKALSANPSPRELKQVIDSIRVWIAALKKAGNIPTVNDFVAAGVVAQKSNALVAVDQNAALPVPPKPESVVATGVVGGIVVSWDVAGYQGHSITEVWRAAVDDLGQAAMVGSASVSVYTDIVPDGSPDTVYYYWLRFRNSNGVTGSYNATAGTAGSMLLDPQVIADQLAGKITTLQLAAALKSQIDLLDISNPLQAQLDGINAAASALSTDVSNYTTQFTDSFEQGSSDLLQAILDTDSAFQDIATQSTQLASLQAQLDGAIALFSTDATAQIDALNALTAQISTLQTSVDSNTAAITAEEIARSNADSSQAATMNQLRTDVDNNASAVVAEQQARTDGDTAEAQARQALAAQILGAEGDASASGLIYDEAQVRAQADSVNAQAITALTARVTDVEGDFETNEAGVVGEAQVRAERDLALAQRTDRLMAETSSAEGVLENVLSAAENAETVRTAKASYDKSIAVLSTDLGAEVTAREVLAAKVDSDKGEVVALVSDESVARATADEAMAEDIASLQTQTGDNAAAITAETLARTDAISAEASDREALATRVGTAETNITGQAQSLFLLGTRVTATEEAVVAQSSDISGIDSRLTDAEGSISGQAISISQIETSVSQAEEDISSQATNISQLSTTVGGHTTTIEQHTQSIDGVSAQAALKIDNNGNVCGIGLASGPTGAGGVTSQFGINVDTFFMTKPGASGIMPFVLTELDPVGAPGVYTLQLNAQVMINGSLGVHQLTTGKLPVDAVVQVGDGITLNGDGTIIVAEAGGIEGNDYVLLTNGQLQYMVFNGTNHVPSKALRNIEMGTAATGQTVSIPGYWKSQPKVMCMLKSLESYAADTAGQSQSWSIETGAIQQVAAGSYQFTPTAQLVLSDGSGAESINDTLGNSVDGSTLYFPIQHTQANCTKITPTIKARSIEATAGGDYQRKICNWRVKYSRYPDLSSAYYSSWKALQIGNTTDWVTDSMALSLSSDDWYFRIEAYFSDDSGTFAGPGTTIIENTHVDTIVAEDVVPEQKFTGTLQALVSLGSMPVPAGFTADDLVSATYDFNIGVYADRYSDPFTDYLTIDWTGYPGAIYHYAGDGIYELGTYNTYSDSFSSLVPKSYTTDKWLSSLFVEVYGNAFDGNAGLASLKIENPTVTLLFRKTVSPSTTPDNDVEFEAYSYELSSKTVLADGTVTWVAIGD